MVTGTVALVAVVFSFVVLHIISARFCMATLLSLVLQDCVIRDRQRGGGWKEGGGRERGGREGGREREGVGVSERERERGWVGGREGG